MESLSEVLHYAWIASFGIISYFLRDVHGKFKESEGKILQLQLEVQKQGTENDALFKRMDEVKHQLRDLNGKLDQFLVHFTNSNRG